MYVLHSTSQRNDEFVHAYAVLDHALCVVYGRCYALDDLLGPSDCVWMIPQQQHKHDWVPTDNWLIDRCSVCGEERA